MAKKTESLNTGNPGATKPGKGETFIVTQEAFDAAFNAGRTVAGAYAAAGAILQPLLVPLSGQESETAVAQWRELQRGFCMGMAAERNIDPDSARRQFLRLVEDMGFTKPQTAEAKRKAAARKAAAPAADGADSDAGEPTPKDGAGAVAAKMALSAMEAHLISMIRAGKFTQAAQCVADMATQAATL